jgi:DNA-binding CsgD family transcriptional regulator
MSQLTSAQLYREWEQLMQSQSFTSEDFTTQFVDSLRHTPLLAQILEASPAATLIVDLRTRAYCYVSPAIESLTGYPASEFLKVDSDLVLPRYHPEDLARHLIALNIGFDFLLRQPPASRKGYIFSNDIRYLTRQGRYTRLLHQSRILQQDSEGNLTHSLFTLSSLDHLNLQGPLTAAILDAHGALHQTVDFTTGTLRRHKPLSPRQRQILQLIGQGLSSKEIAQTLQLKLHTVHTHRRDMLTKMGCRSTGELMRLALTFGLI